MSKIKWKYQEHERPKGKCYDCKEPYASFPDMIIPDHLWEKINPTYYEGAGILCPTCICKRLDELGLLYNLEIVEKEESK